MTELLHSLIARVTSNERRFSMMSIAPENLKLLLAAYQLTPEQYRLWTMFVPEQAKRRVEAYVKKTRFVHYTSADAALKIARSSNVWLRNTGCMNDFSEVQYGIERVVQFFGSPDAKPFWEVLGRIHPELEGKIKKRYDELIFDLKTQTYLMSLSEHDQSEDRIGRLSMWRAYGSSTGVAMVLNSSVFHGTSEALNAYSYPVCYLENEAAISVFKGIVQQVQEAETFLTTQDWGSIEQYVHTMLEYFSLCMKHPGFAEEREWRVIHRPKKNPSSRVTPSVEIVGGVPQIVYNIKLADIPEEGLVGMGLPSLIERIIIGPTQFPVVIYNALVAELERVGVAGADRKVFVSDIPIR